VIAVFLRLSFGSKNVAESIHVSVAIFVARVAVPIVSCQHVFIESFLDAT
jgi:hypothetical protein